MWARSASEIGLSATFWSAGCRSGVWVLGHNKWEIGGENKREMDTRHGTLSISLYVSLIRTSQGPQTCRTKDRACR